MTIRGILRRYYGIWAIYSFGGGFLYGVYPLFLRSRGLDQFQMNSVLATYFFVTFLTDVPTGAFADALGRRRSFVLGCALRFAAFLIYFFAYHYAVFLVAESIDGVGTTFCNGAIDAWGVDTLDAHGYARPKNRLFSRVSQLSNLGFMLSALIGAYAANINIAWPWLLGAAGYFVAGACGMALMRERRTSTTQVIWRGIPAMLTGRIAAGLRQGWNHRTVMLLSLANGIFFAAWAPYWLQWPQYFNDAYHTGIWIVGWFFCLFTIARMIGAEMVVRTMIESHHESVRPILMAAITIVLSAMLFAAGLGSHYPSFVIAALFGLNICFGAATPLLQSWFNEQIGAGERATLLSFNSTFSTIGASIGLLIGGAVADYAGLGGAWILAGGISITAAFCFWSLRSANSRQNGSLSRA